MAALLAGLASSLASALGRGHSQARLHSIVVAGLDTTSKGFIRPAAKMVGAFIIAAA